jgi:hypothetical protein
LPEHFSWAATAAGNDYEDAAATPRQRLHLPSAKAALLLEVENCKMPLLIDVGETRSQLLLHAAVKRLSPH